MLKSWGMGNGHFGPLSILIIWAFSSGGSLAAVNVQACTFGVRVPAARENEWARKLATNDKRSLSTRTELLERAGIPRTSRVSTSGRAGVGQNCGTCRHFPLPCDSFLFPSSRNWIRHHAYAMNTLYHWAIPPAHPWGDSYHLSSPNYQLSEGWWILFLCFPYILAFREIDSLIYMNHTAQLLTVPTSTSVKKRHKPHVSVVILQPHPLFSCSFMSDIKIISFYSLCAREGERWKDRDGERGTERLGLNLVLCKHSLMQDQTYWLSLYCISTWHLGWNFHLKFDISIWNF